MHDNRKLPTLHRHFIKKNIYIYVYVYNIKTEFFHDVAKKFRVEILISSYYYPFGLLNTITISP